jgi:hypothetical protein
MFKLNNILPYFINHCFIYIHQCTIWRLTNHCVIYYNVRRIFRHFQIKMCIVYIYHDLFCMETITALCLCFDICINLCRCDVKPKTNKNKYASVNASVIYNSDLCTSMWWYGNWVFITYWPGSTEWIVLRQMLYSKDIAYKVMHGNFSIPFTLRLFQHVQLQMSELLFFLLFEYSPLVPYKMGLLNSPPWFWIFELLRILSL